MKNTIFLALALALSIPAQASPHALEYNCVGNSFPTIQQYQFTVLVTENEAREIRPSSTTPNTFAGGRDLIRIINKPYFASEKTELRTDGMPNSLSAQSPYLVLRPVVGLEGKMLFDWSRSDRSDENIYGYCDRI